MWLSLVEYYVRDVGAAGSNPVTSTRKNSTVFSAVFIFVIFITVDIKRYIGYNYCIKYTAPERRQSSMAIFYDILLALSIGLTILYAFIWHRHFDVHLTLIFAFIPIAMLGYSMATRADDIDSVIIAQKIIYIGGCFLMLFILRNILHMCKIKLSQTLSTFMLVCSMLVYAGVLTIGRYPYFYKSISLINENGTYVIKKEYGSLHTVFYVLVTAYFLVSVSAMVYSYIKKKDVSRKMLYLLFTPVLISFVTFVICHMRNLKYDMIPLDYVIAQIVYLVIVYRVCLYDIDETVIDTLVQTGDTGIISVDLKYNYLGSNETAKEIFPELKELAVDEPISTHRKMKATAMEWITEFQANEEDDKVCYKKDDRSYLVDIRYLYVGRHKRGYQFILTDDTKNQQYIELINKYNDDLRNEVAEKTAHIVEMHDNLILSMATMVESRDNSTGGHIRRTSDVVRMLLDEMKKDDAFELSESFCRNMIKAAPMHDLGKIAVDDAVLRKPGRFTDEEYEKMKLHASEGARIVHEILKGTDDEEFRIVAENVAHYHHERWDGSGYPTGISGEDIPLEARIMAIADVYDALVSKRVYKDSMPPEKANAIIMDGMGRHFDKRLEPYYVKARPRLEEYYRNIE